MTRQLRQKLIDAMSHDAAVLNNDITIVTTAIQSQPYSAAIGFPATLIVARNEKIVVRTARGGFA
jgi:hypothetical protein